MRKFFLFSFIFLFLVSTLVFAIGEGTYGNETYGNSSYGISSSAALANQQQEIVGDGISEVIVRVGSPVEDIIVNSTDDSKDLNISLTDLKNTSGEVTLVNDFNVTRQTSSVNYTAEIPSGTVISGGSDWDGRINVPTVRNAASYSAPSGTADVVIDVGSGNELNFSNKVKITIGGQAGKKAAWARGTSALTEITTVCDSAANPANINTNSPRECYIDSGSDLIIWTYHFTQFGSFTPASPPSGGGGTSSSSGGGGGGGGNWGWECPAWSECSSSGMQSRTCNLVPGGSLSTKPAETQSCTYKAPAPAEKPKEEAAKPTPTAPKAPITSVVTPTAPSAPTGFAALTGAVVSDLKKPSTWIGIVVAVLVLVVLYTGYYYLYKKKQ